MDLSASSVSSRMAPSNGFTPMKSPTLTSSLQRVVIWVANVSLQLPFDAVGNVVSLLLLLLLLLQLLRRHLLVLLLHPLNRWPQLCDLSITFHSLHRNYSRALFVSTSASFCLFILDRTVLSLSVSAPSLTLRPDSCHRHVVSTFSFHFCFRVSPTSCPRTLFSPSMLLRLLGCRRCWCFVFPAFFLWSLHRLGF